MNLFGKQIDLGENPTKETIAAATIKLFNEHWTTGYEYGAVEPTEYISKEIDNTKLQDKTMMMCMIYLQTLTNSIGQRYFEKLDPITTKEITSWEQRGGYCIYTSVVLWCLLYESGLYKENEIKLVQGYNKHPWEGILEPFLKDPNDQIGLHAWVEADGSVIDFAIHQEEMVFNFENGAYIMGNIPDKLELVGWPETKETVKKYARQIARESGKTYYEWIRHHKSQAARIASNAMQDYMNELKKEKAKLEKGMKSSGSRR